MAALTLFRSREANAFQELIMEARSWWATELFFMSNLGPENPLFEMDAIPFLAITYAEARHLWNLTRTPITDLFAKQGIRLLYSVP